MAIESGAKKLNISGQEMERRLKEQDLIHQRLIGQYELLHTQSLDYVADDIAETLINWERNNDQIDINEKQCSMAQNSAYHYDDFRESAHKQ